MRRRTPERPRLGQRIIAGMRELLADIRTGKTFTCRKVTRYHTPDGPMHVMTTERVKLGEN